MTQQLIMDFFKQKGRAKDLSFESDLFAGGFIDSLFALEMVLYLEDTFRIRIPDGELSEANFRSINAIAAVVARTLEGKGG